MIENPEYSFLGNGKIYHAKVFDWLKTQKLNYKS